MDDDKTDKAPESVESEEQPEMAKPMLDLLRRDQQRRRARSLGDGSFPARAFGGGTAIVVTQPPRGRR